MHKENILNKYGYGLLADEFIFEDILWDNKDFDATEMCQERFKSLAKTRLLPVFKYVKAASDNEFPIPSTSMLSKYIELHNSFEKIVPSNIEKNIKNLPAISNYTELKTLIETTDTLHKQAGLLLKNIKALTISEIRETLKELFLFNKSDAMTSTHFKRCVMYLDLLENAQ